MSEAWKVELGRFLQLDLVDRLIWLSKLSFHVSMVARGTYAAGAKGVDNPAALRRFTELLHRVSAQQLRISRGELDRMPEERFFELIAQESRDLGIEEVLLNHLQ